MAKKEEEVVKLSFATKDEAKWGSVNYRTSLWQYFFQVNKGQPLSQKDIDKVEKEFRKIQAANETLFAEVEIEEGEGSVKKQSRLEMLEVIGKEVDQILKAKSLSELKRVWIQILGSSYESLKRNQKKYLNDIKDKRKAELIARS